MTKTGPRDHGSLAAIRLEWWPRSNWNRWPPSSECLRVQRGPARQTSDGAEMRDVAEAGLNEAAVRRELLWELNAGGRF